MILPIYNDDDLHFYLKINPVSFGGHFNAGTAGVEIMVD
jgi:hypothetical protein